jgi:hypothetical protein
MPVTNFPEYAQNILRVLDRVVLTGEVVVTSLQVDQRSALRGYITGSLQFDNGSALDFREFVDVTRPEPKIMYAYHYQDAAHQLIFRYDNAAHRPALPAPEHKHTPSGIEGAPAPTLAVVIDLILRHLG